MANRSAVTERSSSNAAVDLRSSWLSVWQPENKEFWEKYGKKLANKTLWITTASLTLSFATWFMVSAIVVRLPNLGFNFTVEQRFWLAAIPGLSGATMRLMHAFLAPVFGTRNIVTFSTALMLIPTIGLGIAVQNPQTPFWLLMLLAATAGFGGGNFSSFMPSTSLWFPKAKQGYALGVQAGIGNLGVSLAQFITPWIITMPLFGFLAGNPLPYTKDGAVTDMWIQNAAFWYVPLLVIIAMAAWFSLKSLPVKASLREQAVIFKLKHNWIMTSLYIMTFGSFAGFSAAFPLLIKELYGPLPGAPDPLKYAFLGPLIGSIMRTIGGILADKIGGARLTHITGILLLIGAVGVTFFTKPTSVTQFTPFLLLMLLLFFAAGIGNGSTFRQIPFIFPPKEAAPVLGWTSAVAAYGSFIFPLLFGQTIGKTGSPNAVFLAMAVFYLINIGLNWWFYLRRGCEKPC